MLAHEDSNGRGSEFKVKEGIRSGDIRMLVSITVGNSRCRAGCMRLFLRKLAIKTNDNGSKLRAQSE